MFSERFDPAPPPSRENCACYPYVNTSKLEREREREQDKESYKICRICMLTNHIKTFVSTGLMNRIPMYINGTGQMFSEIITDDVIRVCINKNLRSSSRNVPSKNKFLRKRSTLSDTLVTKIRY